jgi:hypothetical protein
MDFHHPDKTPPQAYSYLTPIRYPGNDNNWSTQGISLKAFKFSWFRVFRGALTTKFCTDLCEEPENPLFAVRLKNEKGKTQKKFKPAADLIRARELELTYA